MALLSACLMVREHATQQRFAKVLRTIKVATRRRG